MDEDGATLSVGFAIETGGSFEELLRLQQAMGSTEAQVVADATRIEKATAGMISPSATAQFTSFGNAASRELATIARETNRAEKAGEGMVRQLNRQIETFGKTASEIRQMRAEMRAVAAESQGLTELAGRIRAASAAMDQLEASAGGVGVTAGRSRGSMMQFGMQMNDVATMAALGAPPMQIFASQIGQIVQVAQMAEGGVRGFMGELGGVATKFGPVIAVVAVAAAAFGLFSRAVSSGIDTKPMIDSLGLTRAEIKKLENTTVGFGDVAAATFQVLAERVGLDMGAIKEFFSDALDFMTTVGKNTLALLYSQFVGTFRAIGAIVRGVFSGKSIGEILTDVGDAYTGSFEQASSALTQFGEDVTARIKSNKLADLRRQAAEIRADRTPRANQADRHAESLAREAAAMEAQITGLYALATAYTVSGAAALVAEARVKAETDAIKKRGDVEAMVGRQIRLAIAERVSDAAKNTASLRDQVRAQAEVNATVAAGLAPASRAAELVQAQIADLPLLAAIEVAQQRGLADEAARATAALAGQRAERERLAAAEERARFNTSIATGDDRLEQLREELRLVGATQAVRVHALATLRATQEAESQFKDPYRQQRYINQQVEIADLEFQRQLRADAFNKSLMYQAELLDILAANVNAAGRGLAEAFGDAGQALGSLASRFADYIADQERLNAAREVELTVAAQIANARDRAQEQQRINSLYAARALSREVGLFGDLTDAARGFFEEGSDGYKAMTAAVQVFRAIEFALSVRAMVQDAAATASSIAKSGARAAASAVEAVAKALASLPFPANLAAGAATAAALAAIGISIAGGFGGGGSKPAPANNGTGTVLGDPEAKSESIKRAIDQLKEVDTLTNAFAREMAASLKSIDSQMGGFASLIVRTGDINASGGVTEGFKSNMVGAGLGALPLIGGILGGLFGTKTTVTGSGLFGEPQSLGSILGGGFDASYYSDVQKKKKLFGITMGTKYSTQLTGADAGLENQFTLILRSFNNAITAAAGPLGVATSDIAGRLSSFVVDIGKIDLQGLTGEQIEEKLSAVFGAAADRMASAAFPGLERFQQVGEGTFETLVRVASTVEAVTTSLNGLGSGAAALGIDAKMGLAGQFESLGDMVDAVGGYFDHFYTKEEQNAARAAQLSSVFASLGVGVPGTLAAFRSLVEAQDLTTAAGQQTYAALLQLAPAFADLQESMEGAKSAADVLSERQDLQRQLLQLQGDTAALRELELAKLDASNRALQREIWAIQDAQEAARAADELRQAWQSVGDSIMDEVRRIRGLSDATGAGGFAALMGRFNAATTAARGGDQDAAKSLPGLSQALLEAARNAATSRQELDRVRGQIAASLEATNSALTGFMGAPTGTSQASYTEAVLAAAAATQAASTPSAANDDMASELRALREEVAGLRSDNNAGHAATAANTGSMKRTLENVTQQSGGDAISTVNAA